MIHSITKTLLIVGLVVVGGSSSSSTTTTSRRVKNSNNNSARSHRNHHRGRTSSHREPPLEDRRHLFIEGRKDGPKKAGGGLGVSPPGLGEMGPDGIPDLVIYHYANQEEEDADADADAATLAEAETGAATLDTTDTSPFPNINALDESRQESIFGFSRNRMRGNALTGDQLRGGYGYGDAWGSSSSSGSSRDTAYGKSGKASKATKSDKSGKGCYTRAQQALRKKGKSSKGTGKGGNCGSGGDDDDDDDDDGGDGSYDYGGGGNPDYGGGSGNPDYPDGGGPDYPDGGNPDYPDGGNPDYPDGGDDDNGDGATGGDKGVCRNFPVALVSDDGDVNIEFNPATADQGGIAALVEPPEDPQVKKSDSRGFAVEVSFQVDTLNAKVSDNMNGDDKFTEEDVAMKIDQIVNPPSALDVAGCSETAMKVAGEIYEVHKVDKTRRQLEDVDTQLVVVEDWICENGNCKRDGGSNCDLKCDTNFYYYGDLESSEVRQRINDALKTYFMLMDDTTNWYPTQQATINIDEISTDKNGGDAIVEGESSESKETTRAGPYIGAAAGALALLLILILLVRRNRRNDDDEEISHLKLDDDGDDTFVQEIESTGTPDREYQTRDAHVIGESDSIFSHWTGYSGKRPLDNSFESDPSSGRLGHVSTDVHKCASATCDLCEARRQQGVNFVSTAGPSHPDSIPEDSFREYAADDTVSL
ncbi:MAG: hypothetical protein SGILL_001673 [Bacillariaceae sp.]